MNSIYESRMLQQPCNAAITPAVLLVSHARAVFRLKSVLEISVEGSEEDFLRGVQRTSAAAVHSLGQRRDATGGNHDENDEARGEKEVFQDATRRLRNIHHTAQMPGTMGRIAVYIPGK